MEKYREGQKELHCGFVELEKAYDKVQREEVWYCMRQSGLGEKYVRIVQDMYDDSTTAVRCAVGVTEGVEVKVGLHQEEEEEEEEETLFDPKSTNVQITIPHISDIQFKQLCTHIYRHYVHKHSS